jgi:hypothetical protein
MEFDWPIEREQLLGHTSEQHAAEVVLPMESCGRIIRARTFDRGFPVDILAEEDGV